MDSWTRPRWATRVNSQRKDGRAMRYMVGIMLVPTTIALVWLLMTFSSPISEHKGTTPNQHKLDKERATAVKDAFKFAWNGYYQNAFPHDELKPASNRSGTSRNDWGATAVDALGTAILMDMPDVVSDILDFIPKIDYNHTTTSISLFETNIRYLGGMISAYDLLSKPFASMVKDKSAVDKLLVQSQTLADYLSIAFNTSSGIPQNRLSFNGPHSAEYAASISLADAGTLILEWTRLSDLLNDKKYTEMAQKAESYLLAPQPPEAEPFPGLVGQDINVTSGLFINTAGSWGGSADSFYEYLIKMYVYDPARFGKYKDRWVLAADSTMKYLASHPSSRPDLTFLAKFNGKRIIPESGHLALFAGGNFLLGGQVLGESKYTKFGLELIAGGHETYISTQTGIGPETFTWIPAECTEGAKNTYPPDSVRCDDFWRIDPNDSFYQKSGFRISDASYNLRPELFESYYYAYRMTKDPKYKEWAWNGFLALSKACKRELGFNYLSDVRGGHNSGDNQESYFFSETLKYLYLIFAKDGPWHVNYKGKNAFVYSTEGHPLRVK